MKTNKIPKIALALDNISEQESIASLIRATSEWISVYKIGLEQFVRFGPPVIELVRSAEKEIFLDLKLHDIPNTVGKAVESAIALGVEYLTIHTQGGIAMMEAAVAAKRKHPAAKTALMGVTLLTSIGEESLRNELQVQSSSAAYVRHLAQLAVEAQIDGIVCSAADLEVVTPVLPEYFEVITPGIRPSGTDVNDQKRVATPKQAVQGGATVLVVGRAITAAFDPGTAAKLLFKELTTSF